MHRRYVHTLNTLALTAALTLSARFHARADVRSLTLGIDVACPYGLAG